ncbi:MAG: SHOCT domain-containing protein [Bacteroidales bacterium]
MYNGNYYWGMDLIWWFVWLGLLFWIFALPYNIPGQRRRKEMPFDILQKRFAAGEITSNEYQEKKKILEEEFSR